MKSSEIRGLIERASPDHPLRTSNDSYLSGFIDAMLNVYGENCEKQLREKFLIASDIAFSLDRYVQSASELSVQNHLKMRAGASEFETNKKVNPPKDVDAFCKYLNVSVSIEVKCAVEEAQEPPAGASRNNIFIRMSGRVPEHRKKIEGLQDAFNTSPNPAQLNLLKNKDNNLKDFLVSANSKFRPDSGISNLNILFVACGDAVNLNAWNGYLYGNPGFFTETSLIGHANYELVDVVILSSLNYVHRLARNWHDWTLKDVLLIPFANPYHRKICPGTTVINGLKVFDHHMKEFGHFDFVADAPSYIKAALKMLHYIMEGLPEDERKRYFPV